MKRSIIIGTITALLMASLAFSATYKSKGGMNDLEYWDGVTDTFQRRISGGGTLTVRKIGNVVDVKEAYGDGTISEVALTTAVGVIGTRERTIELAVGTWPVTANLTIPSTMSVHMVRGAIFSVSSGITLTVNGALYAEEDEWYSGSGTVTITDSEPMTIVKLKIDDDLTVLGVIDINGTDVVRLPDQATFLGGLIIGDAANLSATGLTPIDPLAIMQDITYRGTRNTFLGIDAGRDTTGGIGNIFLGYGAGLENVNGTQNTFVGWWAGKSNIAGYHNTYLGVGAGQEQVEGVYNIYIGTDSGLTDNGGNYNVVVGTSSGVGTGSYNTIVGNTAGGSAGGLGDANSMLGQSAGNVNTTGSSNVFIGRGAAEFNKSGSSNVYVGTFSGRSNTSSNENTFIGHQSGYENLAAYNTGVGYLAGNSNTTGEANTFVGNGAGRYNTTGQHSTFVGYRAGSANNGDLNGGFGSRALEANVTGTSNTATGAHALKNNLSGDQNVSVGNYSSQANTSGNANSTVGYQALFYATGSNNVGIGWRSGLGLTGATSNNTFIGYAADTSLATVTNSTALGRGAVVTKSNQVVIGNASVTETVLRGDVVVEDAIVYSPQSSAASTATGTVAYADSTNWNPGSGEGLYVYSNGGWEKLH